MFRFGQHNMDETHIHTFSCKYEHTQQPFLANRGNGSAYRIGCMCVCLYVTLCIVAKHQNQA